MNMQVYEENVFINCPFTPKYSRILNAIVFAVYDCGFRVYCTIQEEDASQIRIQKIYRIIADCKYGIHDISLTDLDPKTKLPRFNMPLELGIFLGAKRFGKDKQRRKNCLVFDKDQYRYQKFISDISGQDIKAHKNRPKEAISIVRNWLRNASNRSDIPGPDIIWNHYHDFMRDFPQMCYDLGLDHNTLIFNDYVMLATTWLKELDSIVKPYEDT